MLWLHPCPAYALAFCPRLRVKCASLSLDQDLSMCLQHDLPALVNELGGDLQEVTDRTRQLMALDQHLRAALAEKAAAAAASGAAPASAKPSAARRPIVNAASLVRGLRRRSWTGPAWLGGVAENGEVSCSWHHVALLQGEGG